MAFDTRRERILQQGKQRQMLTSDRVPLGTEGSDGDIRIAKTTEGTRLLVKSGSEWLGTSPLMALTNKANTNEIEHSFVTKLKDKNNNEALTIDSSMTVHKPLILNSTLNVSGTVTATTFSGTATTAIQVTSEGVVESCRIKIFQGTSAAVNNAERITHGIGTGKKRIAMVSVSISSDNSPSLDSHTPPNNSFLTGGGSVQDEIDVNRQFQTYYDDTYIYIVTDSDADDVAGNQYVCTVWYTGTDIY
tara:strand:+ start:42 stop:782 length:741 start_codon:yes stop_codon:yes gene_type:complete